MYKLKIPDDAEAGATLSVVINGQELEIPMPEGGKPGDVFEFEIGGMPTDQATEADGFGEPDSIELPNDLKLTLCSEVSVGGISDGTAGFIWCAGRRLATLLASQRHLVRNRKVIELGAGCGLVGIAASEAGAAEVLLTDHAAVVPLLEHNISLNEAKGGNTTVLTAAATLEWGSEAPSKARPYDVVLGSDLLYNTAVDYQKLVRTIVSCLCVDGSPRASLPRGCGGCMIIGVRWRKPEEERQFFILMIEAGFGEPTLLWPESGLSWSEFGVRDNPKSQAFFRDTLLTVGAGNAVCLGEAMGEEMQEAMSAEEIEEFDNKMTQVYRFNAPSGKAAEAPSCSTPAGKRPHADDAGGGGGLGDDSGGGGGAKRARG
jgi:hypothetical protein